MIIAAILFALLGSIVLFVSGESEAPVDGSFSGVTSTPQEISAPTGSGSPATSTSTEGSVQPSETALPSDGVIAAPSDEAIVTPEAPAPNCGEQTVQGVEIPSIQVSAKTVSVGLDQDGVLGAPDHAHRMFVGVYTDGVKPGQDGNILLDGHTYANGGASVFDEQFGQEMQTGVTIHLVAADCTYTYTVQTVWPTLAKEPKYVTETAPLFADVVNKEDLFRQDGPPGLVLMTCSGEFDEEARHHHNEAVVYATLTSVEQT